MPTFGPRRKDVVECSLAFLKNRRQDAGVTNAPKDFVDLLSREIEALEKELFECQAQPA
jgi:hypothetical protein